MASPDRGEDIGASPTRIANDALRHEAKRALVWAGVVALAALAILIAQSLLVIFGGLVFAAMIDGGARLLGRVLHIRRGARIAIVLILAACFLYWIVTFAGTQLAEQAALLPPVLKEQAARAIAWAQAHGFAISPERVQAMMNQLLSRIGTITSAVGGVLGGVASVVLIVIMGVYVALEPHIYQRGVAWLMPENERAAVQVTLNRMARTMRRLMAARLVGMTIEGIFTWLLLQMFGVPMAVLLGILTGLLAFIPNLGAGISGTLMVLVGFSGGSEMGFYTILVYLIVQSVDGYLIVPMVTRKSVDLAPAVVLSAQLIFGGLFGILGLTLADPMLAMIKVALERRSETLDAVGEVA